MSCLQLTQYAANGCRCLRPNGTIAKVSQRFWSESCKEEESRNKCTTKGFEQVPCQMVVKKRDRTIDSSPQYSFLMKSLWEKPKCCVTCPQAVAPLRHDILYLQEFDRPNRRYQRTWPQCPKRSLVPKKCVFEKPQVPEMERRSRGEQNPDAKMCLPLHDCYKVEKYVTPCKPVSCKSKKRCIFSEPSCCQKRCTMYPSYSECCSKPPNKKRPNECACLYPNGLCEVNEWARRMGLIKMEK